MILLPAFLLLVGCSAPGEDDLKLEEMQAHITYLASDELEGRMTGSPGGEKAGAYIAEQFKLAGLETLPGADGYTQSLPYKRLPIVVEGTLGLERGLWEQGRDLLVVEGPALETKADAVFLPELENHDSDLSNKVVMVPFGTGRNLASAMRAKRRTAAQGGAVALVELYTGPRWDFLVRILASSIPSPAWGEPEAEVRPIPHLVLYDSNGAVADLVRKPGSHRVELNVPARLPEPVTSSNIVGTVKGTDSRLRDEYVIVMAHYDHLGRTASTDEEADTIYNGARDNAMGVTALLGAARALGSAPPKRSVIFLALTGEEVGTTGSRFYVEHPLAPLKDTVFALNSDNAGFNDANLITVAGLKRTGAASAIEAAASDFEMEVIENPSPELRLFYRSDNINFARAGIPAPTFSAGFRAWDDSLTRYYHRLADEVGPDFDFDYLLRFSQAFARAARRIADLPDKPRWASGDEFEAQWKILHGDGAADNGPGD